MIAPVMWTPRPRRSDEPACWSWQVPALETPDEFVARVERENAAEPDPDERCDDPRGLLRFIDLAGDRFVRFHAGRCAVCGRGGPRPTDHCHETGQQRGYLCRSCNVLEGRSGHIIFDRYRRVHPAAILGYYEQYHDGIGWIRGWSVMQHGSDIRATGRRPFTPWPALDMH